MQTFRLCLRVRRYLLERHALKLRIITGWVGIFRTHRIIDDRHQSLCAYAQDLIQTNLLDSLNRFIPQIGWKSIFDLLRFEIREKLSCQLDAILCVVGERLQRLFGLWLLGFASVLLLGWHCDGFTMKFTANSRNLVCLQKLHRTLQQPWCESCSNYCSS